MMAGHSVAGLAEREGSYFLAKRKAGGALGLKWELPGGKVEEGEEAAGAMRREWMEELELSVQVGPLLGKGEFSHKGKDYVLEMFQVHFDGEPRALHEHTEWGWFKPAEMDTLDLAPSDRTVLSRYFPEVQP